MKIALLKEDKHAADLIDGWLRSAGHATVVHGSGRAFMHDAARETYDLLIVGTHMGGIEMLLWVREHLIAPIPVLRVAADNREDGIVAALKAGADDCMATPLRQAEFLARVEALGRRRPQVAKRLDVLSFGDVIVDLQNRVIVREGRRVILTPKSYDLAVFLLSNLGQLLSRAHLMERIWGRGSGTSTRTLDTHISRLRGDLGLTPENGWLLQSVYQHGYRLEQTQPLPPALKSDGDCE
jgi:DNA-binding response OmpR family regulator